MARKLFQPGQSGNPAGKPKGAISARTKTLQETLHKHGFDLGETWMDLLSKAKLGFENAKEEQKPIYLKIARDLAADIADRMVPRLKAIEHKHSSPSDGLNAEQKLEMMKAATKALEDDVKRTRDVGNGSGNSEPEGIQS